MFYALSLAPLGFRSPCDPIASDCTLPALVLQKLVIGGPWSHRANCVIQQQDLVVATAHVPVQFVICIGVYKCMVCLRLCVHFSRLLIH